MNKIALMQAIVQMLKAEVLEMLVLEMQEIALMHKMQEIVATALATQLETATNF